MILVTFLILYPSVIFAEWADHPIGTAFTEDDGHQWHWQIHSDYGTGCWISYKIGYDMYVQHVDADGNPLSWPEGIHVITDSVYTESDIMGSVATSDGGILAAYAAYYEDAPSHRNHVRVQKISAAGERLWGPYGVYVHHFPLAHIFPTNISCCTDSSDGIWIFYSPQNTNNLYVSGVNADGSLKTEEPINLGEAPDPGPRVHMGPDGDGGVYINQTRSIVGNDGYYNHIDYNMNVEFEEFELFIDPTGSRDTYVLPDHLGGMYYVEGGRGSGGIGIQRVDALRNIEWGIEGRRVNPPGNDYQISSPVLISDNSIAILMQGAGSDPTVMAWLNDDGSPHFGEEYFSIDSTAIIGTGQGQGDPDLLLIPETGNMYAFNYLTGPERNQNNIRCRLLSSQGQDLWAGDSVMVTNANPIELGRVKKCYAALSTDHSAFLLCISYFDGWHARLAKILPDGTVCGQVSDVEEKNFSKPEEFKLLSTYPNPFNHTVNFRTSLSNPRTIAYKIFNLQGQEICSQIFPLTAGEHSLSWQAQDELAAGVYLVRWQVNRRVVTTCKITLLK